MFFYYWTYDSCLKSWDPPPPLKIRLGDGGREHWVFIFSSMRATQGWVGRQDGRFGVARIDENIAGVGSGGGCLSLAVHGGKHKFRKVLGLARNPSKKMRLEESFLMVQSACQSVAYIKSHGQFHIYRVVGATRMLPKNFEKCLAVLLTPYLRPSRSRLPDPG